jgi:hypothetical protein
MWPLTPRLVLIAGCALAVFAVGFGAAWKWQAGTINEMKRTQAEQVAKGATNALNLYHEAQGRADAAEAAVVVLTGQLQTARGKTRIIYRDAVKGDPQCAAQASESLACPHSWPVAAVP